MEYKVCSFFGHRNILSKIDDDLYKHIEYVIESLGVTDFYVGGYGAFDLKSKSCVLQMKKKYPNIKIYLALAYMPTKDTYIDTSYDGSVFLDGLEVGPKRFSITKRNRLMVQESDVIICYIEKNHGGAYTAVKYAENQSKLILNCCSSEIF